MDEEEIAEMIIEERNLSRDVSGHVVFTSSCHLIAPCVVAPGSLTVTSEAVFFTVDEDNPEYKKLDPKVCVDVCHVKISISVHTRVVFVRYYKLRIETRKGTCVCITGYPSSDVM